MSCDFIDLAAQDNVQRHGGVLEEARVDWLRDLAGTPNGSTRWIETVGAIVPASADEEAT